MVSKFSTYLRDSDGSDYADQRYYEVGWGRFSTPDPYLASGGVANPSSWNRFAYVEGDPVNYADRTGLQRDICDDGSCAGSTYEAYRNGSWHEMMWGWALYSGESWSFVGMIGSVWVPGVEATGSGGGGSNREDLFQAAAAAARKNFAAITSRIRSAVPVDSQFSPQMIDCIAGLESSWDPNRNGVGPAAGRTGLFQYNQASWEGEYSNKIPWSTEAVRDIETSVTAKLGGLEARLAIVQKRRPDLSTLIEQIGRAITLSGDAPRFGDAYGAAILDCAANIDSDFNTGFRPIWNLFNR